jgi:PIN domain nuclease of toxin-antitoxin system
MEKIKKYILDACALITYLQNEKGADKIINIFKEENNIILMHAINFGEVYYDALKRDEKIAQKLVEIINDLPIIIKWDINIELIKFASQFKTKYKMSLADSYAIALAYENNAFIVTTDHHEFDIVEQNSKVNFFWLR